jgi:cell division protein FtsQ
MLKRVLNISAWVAACAALVFLLAFTNNQRHVVVCSAVKINILRNNADNRFLDSTVVMQQFADKRIGLMGEQLSKMNIAGLEDILKQRADVESAQVFSTLDGKVTMTVKERKPILRVITYDGDSYYIDEQGELVPLSDRYTAHVPIASGFITEKYSAFYSLGVKGIEADEKLKKTTVLDDLYNMAMFMGGDSLWSAQIDQLYVLPGNEINMVPKIGNGLIAFGTTDDMQEKFVKLRAFYKHAVNAGTLNAYQTINLKFKNQVVCTKKL